MCSLSASALVPLRPVKVCRGRHKAPPNHASARSLPFRDARQFGRLFRPAFRQHRVLHADSTVAGAPSLTSPVATALSRNALGFGFSAGGLLFPYFVGVITELHNQGVINYNSPMAGASAGSLIVASYKSGVPMDDVFEACMELCKDLRAGGTRFRLGPCLKGVLEQLLPDDIHTRCSGNSYIAVTTILPEFQPQLVSQFYSKEDVIQTLLTSCHIPWYLNGSVVTRHRNTWAFDGGITNFMPSPAGVEQSVLVSCFPRKSGPLLARASISPDAFTDWPYTFRDMLPWAFEPAPEDMLRAISDRGRQDARSWCRQAGLSAADALPEPLDIVEEQTVVLPAAASRAESV